MHVEEPGPGPCILLRGLTAWNDGRTLDLLLPWPDPRCLVGRSDDLGVWLHLAASVAGGILEADMAGAVLAPALTDPHVHFRDPGHTDKEDMISGSSAAAAGGYGTVLIMPNTQPAMDGPAVVDRLQGYERTLGRPLPVHYRLCVAASKGRSGRYPNPPGSWRPYLPGGSRTRLDEAAASHPVVALSDDGAAVTDGIAHTVAGWAKEYGIPLLDHCEHHDSGVINQGPVAARLGLPGVPASTEARIVERDIDLARDTGAHIHLQHVSTAAAFAAIRRAKAQGLPITCETAPHYLALSDDDLPRLGAMGKMNPPLRSRADRRSCLEAVADGTVDMIATDHAPHTKAEKARGLGQAPNGVIGLETAYGVCRTSLVGGGWIDDSRLIELMSAAPARLMGLEVTDLDALMDEADGWTAGTSRRPLIDLTAGDQAGTDLVVLAPDATWRVDADRFVSKARNSPFDGMELTGRPLMTVVDGRPVHSAIAPRSFRPARKMDRSDMEGRR
ncbi:dihydroorotase [Bifidobacterium xylocopae]|uniref:Dihydroorotase n=1 Tax=Bifidobacterium xylocopae TaxID=2493119 RepID=A0A366KC47_9BIFI|nr:dihydroorotase [Bifidobacterium xylocopae]RBP99316.1 dihydroorotase [Bifidobacterium xylocopae]